MLCIGGVHIFRMTYLTICYALLEDISHWRTSFFRVCIIGGHVLQFEMSSFYSRVFLIGSHVLLEGMTVEAATF